MNSKSRMDEIVDLVEAETVDTTFTSAELAPAPAGSTNPIVSDPSAEDRPSGAALAGLGSECVTVRYSLDDIIRGDVLWDE